MRNYLEKCGYELVDLVCRDPYAFAHVRKAFGKTIIDGYGFAKRNPKDAPNDEIGEMLAVNRAVADTIVQYMSELSATTQKAIMAFGEMLGGMFGDDNR